MKFIIASFIVVFLFMGCGSSSNDTQDSTATTQKVEQIDDISKNYDETTKQNKNDFIFPSHDRSFSAIKRLIAASNSGTLGDVVYICVGDSTRANSEYDGEHLFYEVSDKLHTLGVDTYLFARAGHTAQEFNNLTAYPTWKDVLYRINSDGRNTIVDISLGINDYWDGNYDFKNDIKEAIKKIRKYKPNTHFMLTMPDRVYNSEGMTSFLRDSYISLSKELNLPLINVVDDLMPTQSSTSYSWYRNDGFYVHLSKEGQHMVATDILLHILDKN